MSNHNNWYKTFFNGMALDLWDRVATPEYARNEIEFIKKIIPLPDGGRILDVPCGSGRHSIALAQEGFNVTGVDISKTYIERLRMEVKSRNLPVEVIEANMMEFKPGFAYDAVICLGNSFNYFDYTGIEQFTGMLGAAVRQDGYLLINTSALAEIVLPAYDHQSWMEVNGLYFLMSNQYDADLGALVTEMQFIEGDKIEKKTAYHFLYRLSEVKRYLNAAGFSIEAVYSDHELSPFKPGARQAYILAIRN
ncbi:MAG: methyltransferase domain-containing protein [Saprospiraceae bacterium]|nr:methyltransferase domain-containing protein [Saprospiraceae bacterium]